MRKNYVYAITLLIVTLSIWMGYTLYLEYHPVTYKNGIFVELPRGFHLDKWEFSA